MSRKFTFAMPLFAASLLAAPASAVEGGMSDFNAHNILEGDVVALSLAVGL